MDYIELLCRRKMVKPKGLKKFIVNNTDYLFNPTCKVPRYVATIEVWHDKLVQRIFAYISFSKEKTRSTMKVMEVCRRVEGFKGCLLKNIYSNMYGKTVLWNEMDDYFYKAEHLWNFIYYPMYTQEEIISKLNIPYCQWDLAKNKVYMDFFSYICAYRDQPKIEYLVKAELYQFVHCYKKLNFKEKELSKIFRVDQCWKKYIKNMSYDDIMTIKNKRRKIHNMEDFKKVKCLLDKLSITVGKYDIKNIYKYACPYMADYLTNDHLNRTYLKDYDDYLYFCNYLKYDMNVKKILCPANMKKEHDRAMKLVEIKKDDMTKQRFFEAYKKLIKYVFSQNNMVILPCESLAQLELESEGLNHCVKTYANKYMDQKTSIMFIRKLDELNRPFVTIEFNNNKIIQARGLNNSAPSEDVIEFIKKWADLNKLKFSL